MTVYEDGSAQPGEQALSSAVNLKAVDSPEGDLIDSIGAAHASDAITDIAVDNPGIAEHTVSSLGASYKKGVEQALSPFVASHKKAVEQAINSLGASYKNAAEQALSPFAASYKKAAEEALGPFALQQRNLSNLVYAPIVAQFKVMDGLTPRVLWAKQLSITALLAESMTTRGLMSVWRSSLALENMASRMVEQSALSNLSLSQSGVLSAQLLEATRSVRQLSDWANAHVARHKADFSGIGLLTGDLRKYVNGFSAEPSNPQLRTAVLSGFAANGLLGSSLLDRKLIASRVAEAVTRVDMRVLSPWEDARLDFAHRLLEAIEALDPHAADLWRGAWEEAHTPRSAAVSNIANCAIETVDRCLRAAAPDQEVMVWLADNQSEQMVSNKRPTRRARISYLFEAREPEQRLLISVEKGLTEQAQHQVSGLQKAKHASGIQLPMVRALLVATESFLAQLLL
jgi:hypothetical protein